MEIYNSKVKSSTLHMGEVCPTSDTWGDFVPLIKSNGVPCVSESREECPLARAPPPPSVRLGLVASASRCGVVSRDFTVFFNFLGQRGVMDAYLSDCLFVTSF